MTRYTTKTDAIHHAIHPALGEYVDEFDVDAIFNRAFAYRVDTTEAGDELIDSAGFEEVVNADEFWRIAWDHMFPRAVLDLNTARGDLIRVGGLTFDGDPFASGDVEADDEDRPVLVIPVEPSEDRAPYDAALAAYGLSVHPDDDGAADEFRVTQSAPVRLT